VAIRFSKLVLTQVRLECKVGNRLLKGYAAVPITRVKNGEIVKYVLTRASGHDNLHISFSETGKQTITAVLGDWRNATPNLDTVKHLLYAIDEKYCVKTVCNHKI